MTRVNRSEGAVALVTGANRGIGLGFVQELLTRGVKKVYAGVRDPSTVTNEFDGLAVEVVELDVTDLESVHLASAKCTDLTMLVNNAGYFANRRLILTDDPRAARQEMEVNYFGVLNTTRAFAGILGENGGGAILNVLSVAGAFAVPFMGGYSPSKAAALTLSTITRAELQRQGTDVLALIVGSVDTRMASHVEGRKESPIDIVRASLDALNRGETVCDTDFMAVESRARYFRDPARFERQMAKLLDVGVQSTGR